MAWRGVARCATSYIADPERSCIVRARDAAGRRSKELYYVLGMSSRGGGLWWSCNCRCLCICSLSLSLFLSLCLLMAATLLNTLLNRIRSHRFESYSLCSILCGFFEDFALLQASIAVKIVRFFVDRVSNFFFFFFFLLNPPDRPLSFENFSYSLFPQKGKVKGEKQRQL